METRPLGETGQESTVLTFGAIALDAVDQDRANEMVESVVEAGVNHVDVAPQYGTAEVKLAPKLDEHREEIFLGCKTLERTYEGAWEKLEESLDRLETDHIDLYQFHAVTESDEIDQITAEDGALKAYREAQEEGIIDHIGLTSHGTPAVIEEAVERIPDLETLMFPVNATVAGKDDPEHAYLDLASEMRDRGLGVIAIKTFAKQPWPDDLSEDERPYVTWYEPYDDPQEIERCLRYTASQDVTTLTNAGDARLVPDILDAARNFEPMDEDEQRALVAERTEEESPVPADLD
jgi:predicted aldo/keto reductase-like oxidoreductase